MEWFEALILGIVQGLTEFLPVSSSGHLAIGNALFGHQDGGDNLTFAVVVHAATVLSTIVVLRKDIFAIFKGIFAFQWNEETQYACKIILSMLPILVVGLCFKTQIETFFGNGLLVVGCCLFLTALLLFFAYRAKTRSKENISYLDAFIIGIAQAVAVLPGLSRSGATIATGLLLGNKKESVAKFSFLMVLVPILGEALLETKEMVEVGIVDASLTPLIIGFLAAFITGCIACKLMINIVKKGKLIYFAYYCIAAAVFCFIADAYL